MHMSTTHALTGERADLLESLARTRYFLRNTTRDLTDEQAAQRITVSELSLGGQVDGLTGQAAQARAWKPGASREHARPG